MFRSLFLLFALLPHAPLAPLGWGTDLDAACAQAAGKDRVILLRQIVCPCADAPCKLDAFARDPWYARDERARALIDARCIPVLVHVAPDQRDEGLVDPGVLPLGKETRPLPFRTMFLTPSRHVIHRLDLCPFSSDVRVEIEFALDVRKRCYDADGELAERGKQNLVNMHWHHAQNPDLYHVRKGPIAQDCACAPPENPSPSRRTWPGYRRGIAWHTDLDEAQKIAKATNRLVLYYQIVGDLNREGC